MFGLDLVTATIQRVFRAEARSAVLAGTLEGIADAIEQVMGERPSLDGAVIVESLPEEKPTVAAIAGKVAGKTAQKSIKKAGLASVELLFVVATVSTIAACILI